jgi:hypothetical protein
MRWCGRLFAGREKGSKRFFLKKEAKTLAGAVAEVMAGMGFVALWG